MPNLAANLFSISGPEARIADFISNNCTSDKRGCIGLNFEKTLPIPGGLGQDETRRWVREHWGVSWFNDFQVLETSATSLRLRFTTDWGPPYRIYRHYAEAHPTLKIEAACIEEGNELSWKFVAIDGQVEETEPEMTDDFYYEVTGEDRDEDVRMAAYEHANPSSPVARPGRHLRLSVFSRFGAWLLGRGHQ